MRCARRQRKAVCECHVRGVGMRDANRNGLLRHVQPQRAVKVIPHRQSWTSSNVFPRDAGMVNAVNTRRHDETSHEPLHVIAVRHSSGETGSRGGGVLPGPECVGGTPIAAICIARHGTESASSPAWTECGRRVEIAIDMMNQVDRHNQGTRCVARATLHRVVERTTAR